MIGLDSANNWDDDNTNRNQDPFVPLIFNRFDSSGIHVDRCVEQVFFFPSQTKRV